EAVRARLATWGERLSVAAVNGPTSTVVSGEAAAIDALVAACEAADVRARKIAVDYASHSREVEAIRDAVLEALAPIAPQAGTTAFYSTVSGSAPGTATDPTTLDAAYWYRNLRETVELAPTIAALAAEGHHHFVEISPHAILRFALEETLGEAGVVLGTLRRDDGGMMRMLRSAGEAFTRGVAVDWARLFAGRTRDPRLVLPTYPFERRRYWLDKASGVADVASAGLAAGAHPLIGAAVQLADGGGNLLTGRLALDAQPWLADHAVGDELYVPGVALVELALAAARQVGAAGLDELTIQAPVIVPRTSAITLQIRVAPADATGHRGFTLHTSSDGATWAPSATGALALDGDAGDGEWLAVWPPAGAAPLDLTGAYDALAARGLHYGPAFRGLRAAWRLGDDVLAEVALPDGVATEGFALHPALADAALHALIVAGLAGDGVPLPFSFAGVRMHATASPSQLRARITRRAADTLAIAFADDTGMPVATVRALVLRPLRATADLPYRMAWPAIARPAAAPLVSDVVVHEVAAGHAPLDRAALAGVLAALHRHVVGGGARLVVVTRRAVTTGLDDTAPDPAASAVWGLVRSAQVEYPDRIVLVDSAAPVDVALCLATGEPQLAIRGDELRVPRLERAREPALVPPAGDWQLVSSAPGTLDHLVLRPRGLERPEAGQVALDVRAAGVNFRDVLIALGMYPDPDAVIGGEGAGVVTAVGDGVTDLQVGDRVLGIFPGAMAARAIADRRWIARLPEGWTFAQGAAVPSVYLTAWYGLIELAGLSAGQRVLIHAATGGVGAAALAIARHVGAEVFATASPGKWPVLRAAGLDDDHIASSRDLGFAERWAGAEIDVVLNALAGPFVDASLGLVRAGGTFVELGKRDLRDPATIERVRYRPFDLTEVAPDVIARMLGDVLAGFASGALAPPAPTVHDLRDARDVFRTLGQGHAVGKLVLAIPRALDPDGAVLITGGTGTLGGLVARHLITAHGVRHLVLASRRAAAATALADELRGLGAETVELAACDVGDRDALARLLACLPRPLTGVVHAAGITDDGVIEALNPERLDRVLRGKADAAWHLHALCGDELAMFVMFSSLSGSLGAPGQANYAAANAFLDGLAHARRRAGLAAQAMAWGLWAEASGITGAISALDRARMARTGIAPVATERCLAWLDAGLALPDAALVPVGLDLAALATGGVPSIFRGLVRAPAAAPAAPRATSSLADTVRALPEAERE
ncbi:MAG TPA: SDR family NAD(P)-dependent oxidoreductase, partial [Kofleriaceae bacterium]|nr:SDR family NAD(P)-dependent oxidoreductase [Kofleriaceae bacterium]